MRVVYPQNSKWNLAWKKTRFKIEKKMQDTYYDILFIVDKYDEYILFFVILMKQVKTKLQCYNWNGQWILIGLRRMKSIILIQFLWLILGLWFDYRKKPKQVSEW